MITNVTSNVEGFVRWVYPGLLLLGLLHMGRVASITETLRLDGLKEAVQVSGLIAVAILTSQVIYHLHRYLLHEWIIQYVLFFLWGHGDIVEFAKGYDWKRNKPRSKSEGKTPRERNPLAFWYWSNKFEAESRQREHRAYMGYRDYSWGITHALGITSWMLLIATFCREPNSLLSGKTGVLWTIIIILALLWVLRVGRNIVESKRFASEDLGK